MLTEQTKQQYEVEVKVLLGDGPNVAVFMDALKKRDPKLTLSGTNNQLNHYFNDAGHVTQLLEHVKALLAADDYAGFYHIITTAKTFSLRTRDQNGTVRLVVKAAANPGEDKDHAVARLEGDYRVSVDIQTLDQALLVTGFSYLSKWSRERREYRYKDYTVCVDKNAGYGYLAEIEKVAGGEADAMEVKDRILAELVELGFEELSQERLGRMFAYYNEHWSEYYRTDKTFTVT